MNVQFLFYPLLLNFIFLDAEHSFLSMENITPIS